MSVCVVEHLSILRSTVGVSEYTNKVNFFGQSVDGYSSVEGFSKGRVGDSSRKETSRPSLTTDQLAPSGVSTCPDLSRLSPVQGPDPGWVLHPSYEETGSVSGPSVTRPPVSVPLADQTPFLVRNPTVFDVSGVRQAGYLLSPGGVSRGV